MNKIYKKILKRENILILVLIFVAFLSIIGIPQKYGITTDKIILTLLAVLALDIIIERIGYLDKIESHILNIETKIEAEVRADDLFRTREQLPSFDILLEEGDIFWIGGKNLVGLLNDYGRKIQEAANKNKQFRFLIHNPDNSSLMDIQSASSFAHSIIPNLKQKLQESIHIFEQILKNSPNGSIEVKLADILLTNAYLIVNGNKSNGKMIIEMYNYQISSGEQYHIFLKKQSDKKMFDFYLQRFESIWKDSKSLFS